MFSRLDTIPVYDRQTNGRTDRQQDTLREQSRAIQRERRSDNNEKTSERIKATSK